jgi:hypothetical protein
MMLRNKKIVAHPKASDMNWHYFGAFAMCIFCNLLMASSPGMQHQLNTNFNKTDATQLALKPAPKPGFYIVSSNTTLSNKIKNAWPYLEHQYLLSDTSLNRTEAVVDFAKKVAVVANTGKNIMVLVREFVMGLELQSVAFYNRPVLDFVEVILLW